MNKLNMFLFAMVLTGFLGAEADEIKPTALFDVDGNLLPEDPNNPAVNWETVKSDPQYMAIGHMSSNGERSCTSFLFKIPNCSSPSKQKAQVMTNGHCTENEARRQIGFGEFEGAEPSVTANVTSTLYKAYRSSVDISMVELDMDYAQLGQLGVKPLELATTPMQVGSSYTTVGFPSHGIDNEVMRKSVCENEKKSTFIDQTSMWPDGIVFNKCSIVGGASGSPLIGDDGKVRGILNAGAVNAKPPSWLTECEYDTCIFDGLNPPQREMKNFGFDITSISKCYKDCKLDTRLPGCPLPDADSAISVLTGNSYPSAVTKNLSKPFLLNSKFKKYQVKGCRMGTGCSCNDPSGYQQARLSPPPSGPSSNPDSRGIKPSDFFPGLGPVAGKKDAGQFLFLCIRGQNEDGSLDSMKNILQQPIHFRDPQGMVKPPPFVK